MRAYDLGRLWAAEHAMGSDFDKSYDSRRLDGDGCQNQLFQVSGHVLVELGQCVPIALGASELDLILLV